MAASFCVMSINPLLAQTSQTFIAQTTSGPKISWFRLYRATDLDRKQAIAVVSVKSGEQEPIFTSMGEMTLSEAESQFGKSRDPEEGESKADKVFDTVGIAEENNKPVFCRILVQIKDGKTSKYLVVGPRFTNITVHTWISTVKPKRGCGTAPTSVDQPHCIESRIKKEEREASLSSQTQSVPIPDAH